MKHEFSYQCEPPRNVGTPSLVLILAVMLISSDPANAQDLFVYPTKGQSQAQQDKRSLRMSHVGRAADRH